MAHRLVKRLYGRTNKRNATKQIGKRVRRLERAQLAALRQAMKNRSKTQRNNTEEYMMAAEQNLEVRYQISDFKRDPVDICAYVHANQGDPAFRVCITFAFLTNSYLR